MPRIPKSPLAIGFALYKTWKRLPPEQRKRVLEKARQHGPGVARAAASAAAKARRRPS